MYFRYLIAVSIVCCSAPIDHSKFLACLSLLGNKSNSDCDCDTCL